MVINEDNDINLEQKLRDAQTEVTMKEYVESKTAKSLYEKMLNKTRMFVVIPLVVFAIMVFALLYENQAVNRSSSNINVILALCILSFVALAVCIGIRAKKLEPYRELYKLARENDEVRHNEKVRYLERERLSTKSFNNENNIDNIKQTLSAPTLSDNKKKKNDDKK